MNLQKLEAVLFKQNGKLQTFQQASGRKLKAFLQEYSRYFEIKQDGKQHLVYLKFPHVNTNMSNSKADSSSYCGSNSSNSKCSSIASGIDDDNTEWTTVNHRRQRSQSHQQIHQEHFPPLAGRNTASKSSKSYVRSYASVARNQKDRADLSHRRPFERENNRHSARVDSPPLVQSNVAPPKQSDKVEDFLQWARNFSQGHYILFTSEKLMLQHREKFSLIPWLVVFDFDEESRVDGMLSVLEDRLKNTRALYVCTWKDPPRIMHHGTEWCLLKGSVQEADSRTSTDPKTWFKTIRQEFEKHLSELGSFVDNWTTLKVIVLWPDDETSAEYIYKALTKMEEYIDNYITIICDPEKNTEDSTKTMMKMLKPDHINNASIEEIMRGIHGILGYKEKIPTFVYKLPTHDRKNPDIDESTASLLREDLHVLYLQNPSPNTKTDYEELTKAEEDFYKGGNIPWELLYEFGGGHLDAERDMMVDIISRIKKAYIDTFKSGFITIYHSPGSGCTTLAQRVLWELRQETPCAQVRINSRSSLTTLVQQIETLFDKTNLPLVLLVEGDDQQCIHHLFKLIDRSHTVVILINTKRYPYSMKDIILREDHFCLNGSISAIEATKLWKKFDAKCDTDEKRDNLRNMVAEVQEGHNHCMYEFGLSTFLNKYKGIDSYIAGYFQLEKNKAGLQPWQRILGYLSLVYYYGHISLPCQFFVNLLAMSPTSDVTIADFPYQVQQFIVCSKGEGKGNSIRICHYVVSKGILEHILSSSKPRKESEPRDHLRHDAKMNMYQFVLEFIDEVKARRSKSMTRTSVLTDILARTIIYRDNRDIGENEVHRQTRKSTLREQEIQKQVRKPNLSRLLSDVDSKPPYTERVNIMKKLTEAFPEDPNFHAHLGRMYSICRPEDESEAERCFDHALDLCKRRTKGTNYDELDESTKHTLRHVYHMFGMFFLQRITKYTGRTHGDKPEIKTTREEFPKRMQDLFLLSERACQYFHETRELTMFGYIEAHGYTGEISVRLRICEFIFRHMPCKDFEELFRSEASNREIVDYIQHSITTIQELFLQCYGTIDIDELPREFFDSIHWYNVLFKGISQSMQELNFTETIYQRRLKVASIKLKYGKDEVLGSLENIDSSQDIEEIVRISEINFRETIQQGLQLSRRALDLEYKDWIHAIRHDLFKKTYTVEDVIRHVRHWNATLHSPNSKFYLFILLSILGFGLPDGSPNDDMLREAHELQEQLKKLSRYLAKPRKPREWLGRGPGIKEVMLLGRKVHRVDDDGFSAQKEGPWHMSVMRGTICRPNIQRQTGYIKLDLGDKNRFIVKVFFVPIKTNPSLVGRRFEGERVEFVLAFTNADGYQAYNVVQLNKYKCPSCGHQMEIKSNEYIDTCKCGKQVMK